MCDDSDRELHGKGDFQLFECVSFFMEPSRPLAFVFNAKTSEIFEAFGNDELNSDRFRGPTVVSIGLLSFSLTLIHVSQFQKPLSSLNGETADTNKASERIKSLDHESMSRLSFDLINAHPVYNLILNATQHQYGVN